MQCFAFFKQMVKNSAVRAQSKVSSWTSTERASRKEASMLSLSFHMEWETLKDRILDMKINM